MKKGSKIRHSEHYGIKKFLNPKKIAMLKFKYFYEKALGTFFTSLYMASLASSEVPKSSVNFYCKKCDYNTCRKSQYERHILTPKHQNASKCYVLASKKVQKKFLCNCGKEYKHDSSYYKHKKVCPENLITASESNLQETYVPTPSNDIVAILLNQNMELIKQNQEFKDLILDQNKKIMEIAKEGKTINNNTTNNNQFNLQLFLNEQCKDALNLKDFVDQIKLQLSDLDMIGRVGYVKGMSKIFLRNLKELDVCKRPIHCSDLKRETLYIKDKDSWEKENGENVKIKRAIKEVEHKNIKQLPKWREENPTAEDSETKKHMEYQNILLEAMGGSTLEDDNKKREKIIRNIAKEVVIEKK